MILGTDLTPSTVLKKTRKKIALTMMKVTAAVPSPNQVIASGIQAMPLTELKNVARGVSRSRSGRLSAASSPRPTPSTMLTRVAVAIRPRLTMMSAWRWGGVYSSWL